VDAGGPASGLLRSAGPNYSATGMLASVESRLPGHNRVKLSYASGDALVMRASTGQAPVETVQTILQCARPRRSQMYSVALSGTAEGTETHWRASYRWQPDSTVTEVAPFAVDASEPYFNIYIRQPIRLTSATRQGAGGLRPRWICGICWPRDISPSSPAMAPPLLCAGSAKHSGGLAFTF